MSEKPVKARISESTNQRINESAAEFVTTLGSWAGFVYSSIRLFVYSSIRLFLMKQKRKQRKTTSPGHGLDLVEKRTGKRDRITC